jgi:hypothetical protein
MFFKQIHLSPNRVRVSLNNWLFLKLVTEFLVTDELY